MGHLLSLRSRFAGNRTPSLDGAWSAQLSDLANSVGGLRCVAEPADAGR
jgi:hypothetical protein